MNWRERHGVWTAGPFTVRAEFDPRTRVVLFELYDNTRYVRDFASAADARAAAENLNGSSEQREAS